MVLFPFFRPLSHLPLDIPFHFNGKASAHPRATNYRNVGAQGIALAFLQNAK
jgi:hypothetical protein